MIPNKFIHSFLHSYKRKYWKRQYVNESLKFHSSDFQFSGRGLRPRFCLRESKFKVQLELSTNLRTRYVRLFSCLYGQSNDDATIEKTIFSTNCRFIFTDVRNGILTASTVRYAWKLKTFFLMKFIIDIYVRLSFDYRII